MTDLGFACKLIKVRFGNAQIFRCSIQVERSWLLGADSQDQSLDPLEPAVKLAKSFFVIVRSIKSIS